MVFDTIDYLRQGTPRQQKAYEVLCQNCILEKLSIFDPILAGTIPLDIDTIDSDLDLICYYSDKQVFEQIIVACFEKEKKFVIRESRAQGHEVVIANFRLGDFDLEIFGQKIPTKEQLGYRHMLIQQQLLVKYGELFRQQIVALKQEGYKTEPAFGMLLGLGDDPYTELLSYEGIGAFFGVRPAHPADLDEIRGLFYDTVTTVNVNDYDEVQIKVWASNDQNIDRWTHSIAAQHFYVAQFQRRIVGFGSLAHKGYIDFLFVHKDFQRQGIAKLLLRTLEQEAKVQEEAYVWADVSLTAVPFFKSQGFEIKKVYAKTVKDVVFQNTIMNKEI